MDVLIYIGLIILGGLLNFLWEPGAKSVYCLAKVYLILAIYLALAVWVFYFAGIKNQFLIGTLSLLIQYGGYLAHLMLGYLSGNILINLKPKDDKPVDPELRGIIHITLWAISVTIGNSYLVASVGKSTNMPYMIGFFKQSGYALWFLYFVIAAETAAAIGILMHFKLKTGALAAIGLILIMLGAVYTHLHNHDPFSDSYAALSQLLNLSFILLLYYFEKQIKGIPNDTQIYVI
jgi:putative oxidoreductase